MTELDWSTVGKREFETGVDHGVLYVENSPGVVWAGLISISDSPVGGDATGYYLDGVKYLNNAASTEFAGTINAYSSPAEFDACDGIASFGGMSFMDQPKKTFGLSYRSKVGNDLEGLEYGYKIHLIYNALAGPASRDYSTLGDAVNPIAFNWPITAKAIVVPGVRPTAHIIFDSETDADILSALEDILYGTAEADPRLPTAEELSDFMEGSVPPPPVEDDIIDGGTPDGLYDSYDGGGP